MTLCHLADIGKSYSTGTLDVHALVDISLTITAGEFVVISGSSGSGKTTLLNLLGLLDVPCTGTYRLSGQTTSRMSPLEQDSIRARHIGFVFQSFHLIPTLTALENVMLSLTLAGRRTDRKTKSMEILHKAGIADCAHRRPKQLSAGQQQRVAIARALVKEPEFILADEPTANLDTKTGTEIIDLMLTFNESINTTFVISSHDPKVISRGRRTVCMEDGRIAMDDQ